MPRVTLRPAVGGLPACLVTVLVLVVAFPAAPVLAQDDAVRADATIRVIHALPDAGLFNTGADGREANLQEGLEFGNATDRVLGLLA